jgi:regulator of protease activity HflC (stomatin/prohibitin superfamily)
MLIIIIIIIIIIITNRSVFCQKQKEWLHAHGKTVILFVIKC